MSLKISSGPLFVRIGGRYVQTEHTVEEFDQLRADLQRLQSSPAPVAGGVPDEEWNGPLLWDLLRMDSDEPDWEDAASRVRDWFVSRLPAIKPGEVETCEWHPGDIPGTGVRGWKTACGEAMYPKHRWRLGVDGFNYCPNCGKRVVQVSDDEWAAQSAQATTTEDRN